MNTVANSKQMLSQRFTFGRSAEREQLEKRFAAHKSFLLHGPAGVGKTLLLSNIAPGFPEVLYSPQNTTPNALFRNLSETLLAAGHPVLADACPNGIAPLQAKSAISIKGLVKDALHGSNHLLIADHLARPSHAVAACLRELMVSCSIPVVAVARSAHMEDAGFVLSLFPDRTERFALRNFDPETARVFAQACAQAEGLQADNLPQFLDRVLEFSSGNPGAILQMIHLATKPRYFADNHIKIAPLYIDYKLATVSSQSGAR